MGNDECPIQMRRRWEELSNSATVDVRAMGMEPDVINGRGVRIPLLMAAFGAIVLGILFVQAFTVSWRAVALFPLAAAFVFGCALFINRLRDFLLFSLMFFIPFQFGYHVLFDPVGLVEHAYRTGIVVDTVDVILLALYLGWLFNACVKPRSGRPLSMGGPIGILFICWLGFLLVSSPFVAKRLDFSYYALFEFFKGFLLFWYLVNNLEGEKDLRIIVYGLFANTVAHAIYICFQYATGLNYSVHGELSRHYVPLEGFRPIGFNGSWDEAAILVATVLSVMLAYALVVAKGLRRQISLVMIVVVALGLLLTKMRSAWLAGLAAPVLVIAIAYFKGRIPSGVVVKGSVALLIVVLVASPFVVHRLITGTRGEVRVPLMETAINMFENNWLAGVGEGNYFLEANQYIPQALRGNWVYTVHNEYLLQLAETGIIGFVLYYLILVLAIKKLWSGTRSSNPWVFALSLGFFAALVASFPNRFFSMYQFVTTFLLYCVILALAHRMEAMVRNE
jgi:hypothetical protein